MKIRELIKILKLDREGKLMMSIAPQDRHGIIFTPEGTACFIKNFANNELYAQELRICLSIPDWCELSNQGFYQDLIQYLCRKGILDSTEIPDNLPD